jgi:hypothetical protein
MVAMPQAAVTNRLVKRKTYDIPDEIEASFTQFCEAKGLVMQKAVAAGMRLIQWMPCELRDSLMEGDEAHVRVWFEQAQKGLVIEAARAVRAAQSKSRARRRGAGGST